MKLTQRVVAVAHDMSISVLNWIKFDTVYLNNDMNSE